MKIKDMIEFDGDYDIMQEQMKKKDMVNSPPHYNKAGIECIDAIRAATDSGYEYYLQGNIMKYVWRYRYKNGKEDLEKAIHFIEMIIERDYS